MKNALTWGIHHIIRAVSSTAVGAPRGWSYCATAAASAAQPLELGVRSQAGSQKATAGRAISFSSSTEVSFSCVHGCHRLFSCSISLE